MRAPPPCRVAIHELRGGSPAQSTHTHTEGRTSKLRCDRGTRRWTADACRSDTGCPRSGGRGGFLRSPRCLGIPQMRNPRHAADSSKKGIEISLPAHPNGPLTQGSCGQRSMPSASTHCGPSSSYLAAERSGITARSSLQPRSARSWRSSSARF
jgi:hypothetical protein